MLCCIAVGKMFSIKSALDAKKQNSAHWNISNVGLSWNSVGLIINF